MTFLRIELIVLLSLIFASAYGADNASIGEVTGSGKINIRKEASAKAPLAGQVGPGATFAVQPAGPEWFMILTGRYNGKYVSSQFVKVLDAKYPIGKITNPDVRVRSGDSTTSPIKTTLKAGFLMAVEANGEWYQIKDGLWKGGFVSSQFVSLVDQNPQTSDTTAVSAPAPKETPQAEAEAASSPEPSPDSSPERTEPTPAPVLLNQMPPAKAESSDPDKPNAPKWDEKKEDLFRSKVEKIFGKKGKSNKEAEVLIPVQYQKADKQVGEVIAKISEGQPVRVDRHTFFSILRNLASPAWLDKPEISPFNKASPADEDMRWMELEKINGHGIQVTFDDKALTILIEIPPEFRKTGSTSFNRYYNQDMPEDLIRPAFFSSFLNINASDTLDSRETAYSDRRTPLRAQFENGTNIGGLVIQAFGTYNETRAGVTSTNPPFTRGDVRLVKDIESKALRVTAGDLVYPTQSFQVYRQMAGVSVVRQFQMQTSRLTYPSGQYELFLQRNSRVQVFINDQLTQVVDLPAGRHNLAEFPFVAGMNNIRFEITDDVGRSETVQYTYFSNSELLRPGLHHMSYAIGNPTDNTTGTRNYNSNTTVSAFHRAGLSETLTVGVNLQKDSVQTVAGGETLLSTEYGYFKLEPAFSSGSLGSGMALGANYLYTDYLGKDKTQRTYNFNLRWRTAGFQTLLTSAGAPAIQTLYDISASHTRGLSKMFSLNLGGTYRIFQKIDPSIQDAMSLFLGLSRRWDKGINTSVTLRHSKTERGSEDLAGLFLLVWSMPEDRQVITGIHNTSDTSTRLDWSYNPSTGADAANYGAGIKDSRSEQGYSGQIGYNGNRAIASLTHEVVKTKETQSYASGGGAGSTTTDPVPAQTAESTNNVTTIQVGTSLVFAGGYFGIGRPVTESFAIFKPVKSAKGQDLEINPVADNSYIAKADWSGAAVVPELGSYNVMPITIRTNNLPTGVFLNKDHYDLFPTYKSGFGFGVGNDATIYLSMVVKTPDGKPMSNQAALAFELADPNAPPLTVFTNKKGQIRSEGFKPGTYRLEIGTDVYEPLEFSIPESATEDYDLGIVTLRAK